MESLIKRDGAELPNHGVYSIVDALDRRLRDSFLTAIERIKRQTTLDQLEQAFATGGIPAAIDLFQQIDEHFQATVVPDLERAVADSGRLALTTTLKGGVTNTFAFSVIDPITAQEIRSHGAQLVQQISESTRAGIERAARDAVITGRPPAATARAFRQSIGLTESQMRSVETYRAGLLSGDKEVLKRALRDKRFDGSVVRILDEGAQNVAQIDKLVTRYKEKSLRYRSQVIARTESMRAISMGDFEAGRQAEESGALRDDIRRHWVFTRDERTRAGHRQIPSLNPEGRKYSESFITPLGRLRYPRDPNGSGSDTIQCRCTLTLKRVGAFI